MKENQEKPNLPKKFLIGGMSGMFTSTIIHPMDTVKVRIQLTGEMGTSAVNANPFSMGRTIFKEGGVRAFYPGLSAALTRQCLYGTIRIGAFNSALTVFEERNGGEPLPFYQKAMIGLTTGGVAAMASNPADMALIRMQADGRLPPEKRIGYRNAADALRRISVEEGTLALWRGAQPTVIRAMVMNCGMLSCYAQSKEYLGEIYGPKSMITYAGSAIVGGFFASFMSQPFDFIKTRILKQKEGEKLYTSMVDCIKKVWKSEGPLAFYRGYPVFYMRIAPFTMINLLTIEQLNKWLE